MEGYITIATMTIILAVMGFLILNGIKFLRSKSNGSQINEFIVDTLERIHSIVSDAVEDYIRDLDPSEVTFSDIDNIVKDILEIVKEKAGEETLRSLQSQEFRSTISYEVDLDEVIRDQIKQELEEKLVQ